jgi:hypothetical protein
VDADVVPFAPEPQVERAEVVVRTNAKDAHPLPRSVERLA